MEPHLRRLGTCASPLLIVVILALTSCGGNRAALPPASSGGIVGSFTQPNGAESSKHITHVIVMIQENRSFDDFFAYYPGADGAKYGRMSNGKRIGLKASDLVYPCDLGHSWQGFLRDYNHGKMDGFDLEGGGAGASCAGPAGTKPYHFVERKQIEPYWAIAQSYVLADHMFQTQGSGSFTAHQDLIAGGTEITKDSSLVDYPSARPWGCNAGSGTKTSLLTVTTSSSPPPWNLKHEFNKGPFPCLKYRTLRDLLDRHHVSWKYYSPPVAGSGGLWNAFEAIRAVRYSDEWGTNVTASDKAIFTDIDKRQLPAMSWLIPDAANSDHPGPGGSDTGPSWVASVVNAVGESPYWKSTVIIVVWDDWGGFYDHVRPPFFDNGGGLGFRVPMLVVSAYARKGYVAHTQYEFGSILKFVENNWDLGSLHTTDDRATSIIDCFDFNKARTFKRVPAKYSREYFERQPPSYRPVDTE